MQHLYWNYISNTANKGYMYSWFDIADCTNTIYLFTKLNVNIKKCIPTFLQDYIYIVPKQEELNICLSNMGKKGKATYFETLNSLGFSDYKLYKLYITNTFMEDLHTQLQKR